MDGHSRPAEPAHAPLPAPPRPPAGVADLAVWANVPLLLTSWVAGLRELQQLKLATTRDLQFTFSLRG